MDSALQPLPAASLAFLRPPTRRNHQGAMTPLVVATSLAMEGLERQLCSIDRRAISVVAGARNRLPANRSLGFCFEIPI